MPKERWLFNHSHPEVEQAYRRVIGLPPQSLAGRREIEIEQVENARLVIGPGPERRAVPDWPQPDR